MQGKKVSEGKLFYQTSLEDLVPADHVLFLHLAQSLSIACRAVAHAALECRRIE
jgi:hypothetical protein